MTEYINGTTWYDTDGNALHAHGGYIIRYGDFYYWYGENRTGDNYVSCYRSKDLLHWEFRRNILTTHSACRATRVSADLRLTNEKAPMGKVNIERPKVLYNCRTNKFVLWAHYENGENYLDARACVASCDTPDGDFTYHGSFNPYGEMSRDCTLFYDARADRAYFVSSARDNRDTHVYRLAKDYLNVERQEAVLFRGELREAHAFFEKNGMYYLLSSWCTGWKPNQGKFSYSRDFCDGWEQLSDFGDETTFRSQPAFVLPVEEHGETVYYYFGDRWHYAELEPGVTSDDPLYFYKKSTYMVLKIRFDENGLPYITEDRAFAGI